MALPRLDVFRGVVAPSEIGQHGRSLRLFIRHALSVASLIGGCAVFINLAFSGGVGTIVEGVSDLALDTLNQLGLVGSSGDGNRAEPWSLAPWPCQ